MATETPPCDDLNDGDRQRALAEMAVDEEHAELARAVFIEKYIREYGAEPWDDYGDLSPVDSERAV